MREDDKDGGDSDALFFVITNEYQGDTMNIEKARAQLGDIKNEIANNCLQSSEFRASLLEDPKGTIEDLYGLESGSLKDIDINIVQESVGTVVMPIAPVSGDQELSDEQLELVAGGLSILPWGWPPRIPIRIPTRPRWPGIPIPRSPW